MTIARSKQRGCISGLSTFRGLFVQRQLPIKKNQQRKKTAPALMDKVWQEWDSLPEDYLPDLRVSTLTVGRLLPEGNRRAGAICWRCPQQHLALLAAAHWWCQFIEQWLPEVRDEENHWKEDLLTFDRDAIAEPDILAALRVAKELEYEDQLHHTRTRPDYIFIQQCKQRWEKYREARIAAQRQLEKLLLPLQLAEAVPQGRSPRRLLTKSDSAPSSRAMPDHVAVALLHAHGAIHPDSLRDFFENRFWNLRPHQAMEMLELFHTPRIVHAPYGPLAVWLADNKPIWEKYGWNWKDIQHLLETIKFSSRIPAATALRQYAAAHDLTPLLGTNIKMSSKFNSRGVTLVTPIPRVKLKAGRPVRNRARI